MLIFGYRIGYGLTPSQTNDSQYKRGIFLFSEMVQADC